MLQDHTIRDIAIVNGSGTNDFLYAAGDGYGLIEIKIGGVTWGSSTPFASGMPFDPACSEGANNYGFRLDAVNDTAAGRNVIALATDSAPVHSREWGPYTPYTGFAWNGHPPYVSGTNPSPEGCDKRVYLYDRNPATWSPSNPVLPTEIGPYGSSASWGIFWRSIDLQIGSDGFVWVLNSNLEMEKFQRQGGVLTNVTNAIATEKYEQRDASFGTGLLSLNDPDLIFFGRDADACGWGLPATIVQPNGSVTIEEVLPPSEEHAIILLANGQWRDPLLPQDREWYLGGGIGPGECALVDPGPDPIAGSSTGSTTTCRPGRGVGSPFRWTQSLRALGRILADGDTTSLPSTPGRRATWWRSGAAPASTAWCSIPGPR